MIVTMGFHTFVAHQVSKATKRYIPSTPFLSIAEKNSYHQYWTKLEECSNALLQ